MEYWGFRVVNTLRILHRLQFNPVVETEEDKIIEDTSAWFISKAQQDFRKDD